MKIGELVGFRYPESVVVQARMGSWLYGTQEQGSDEDWTGIFCEPAREILGIDGMDSVEEKVKNSDVVMHSLQKWAALAAKGNPTQLAVLFATPEREHPVWERVRKNKELFVARRHVASFLGYANAQRKKLEATSKTPAYDGKFAMNFIRLYYEAEDLMKIGGLEYPSRHAKALLEIKHGRMPLERLLALARDLEAVVMTARIHSKLKEYVDRDKISALIAGCYREFWQGQELEKQEVWAAATR